jgi:D-alanine transaminase
MSICYLNGEFLPLEEARIPVLDRGFIFGDGVYEVIPVFQGRLFRIEQHLDRLQNSLDAIRIVNPLTNSDWLSLLNSLVERNGGGGQSVYVQVTRGVAKRDHVLPGPINPTVFAMSNRLETRATIEPVAAISREDIRWKFCHIKAIALLPNILLRQEAVDSGAYETILIRDGWVTEGAASNVFIAKDGVIKTPPKGPYLLPGVTRDLVVELLNTHGVPCQETEISGDELKAADEIWLTSSTREIVPVTSLDGEPVGEGLPGPRWRQTMSLYQAFKAAVTGENLERQALPSGA